MHRQILIQLCIYIHQSDFNQLPPSLKASRDKTRTLIWRALLFKRLEFSISYTYLPSSLLWALPINKIGFSTTLLATSAQRSFDNGINCFWGISTSQSTWRSWIISSFNKHRKESWVSRRSCCPTSLQKIWISFRIYQATLLRQIRLLQAFIYRCTKWNQALTRSKL